MVAAAIAWDEKVRVEASCAACKDPVMRLKWGCDRPAAKPTMRVPCWKCDPDAPAKACDRCGGSGLVSWFRCPRRIAAGADECITHYSLVEAGISPWAKPFGELPDEVKLPFRLLSGRRSFYLRRDRPGKTASLPPLPDTATPTTAFKHRWPGGVVER